MSPMNDRRGLIRGATKFVSTLASVRVLVHTFVQTNFSLTDACRILTIQKYVNTVISVFVSTFATRRTHVDALPINEHETNMKDLGIAPL